MELFNRFNYNVVYTLLKNIDRIFKKVQLSTNCLKELVNESAVSKIDELSQR